MLLLKNPQFLPNHNETLPQKSTHEYLILPKFHNDWVKIVDFSIKAYFWSSLYSPLPVCIKIFWNSGKRLQIVIVCKQSNLFVIFLWKLYSKHFWKQFLCMNMFFEVWQLYIKMKYCTDWKPLWWTSAPFSCHCVCNILRTLKSDDGRLSLISGRLVSCKINDLVSHCKSCKLHCRATLNIENPRITISCHNLNIF